MASQSSKTSQVSPAPTKAASKPTSGTRTRPAKPKPKKLPPWKVLLHNDDVSPRDFVVETIFILTPLNEQEAVQRMLEAHTRGIALLLTTHRERAELYQEQFASRRLTVTIEAA